MKASNSTTRSIGFKLIGGIAVILVLMASLGGVSLNRLGAVNVTALDVRDNWLPSVRILGDLLAAIKDYRLAMGDAVVANAVTPVDVAQKLDQVRAVANAVTEKRREYEPLVTIGTLDETLMRQFDAAWLKYQKLNEVFTTLVASDEKAALKFYAGESRTSFLALAEIVSDDVDFNASAGHLAASEGARIYDQTRIIIAALLAIALLVSAVVGLYLGRVDRIPAMRF